MTNPAARRDTLTVALWAAVVVLVLAVPPMWPYSFYVLLRLVVTGVALYAIGVLGTATPAHAIVLAAIAVLFNPIVPVHLPKAMWVAIDLGAAVFLWSLIRRRPETGEHHAS